MPLKEGAINEILTFATEGTEESGDLLALAEYIVSTLRRRGHQPGIAERGLQNRASRQAAHIAAGLAQFIANRYIPGVKDDGDLDKVEQGLLQAFQAVKYDVGQYVFFQDNAPRPGMVPLLGATISNFSATYPAMAEYLSTTYGQARLVTKAEYDALHVAFWHTNADGTKVGWEGVGGVNKFVWDEGADTLQVPDLAGMTMEQISDSLGVGQVHGDRTRAAVGVIRLLQFVGSAAATGVFLLGAVEARTNVGLQTDGSNLHPVTFDLSRRVPIGSNVAPRAWGSLACVYLGLPAS
jgi:hypothetical protein